MQGDGVYKSTDAGKTWKHIGLADTQAISRIRIHPTNPDIVYVSALGHPYGRNPGARRLPLQGRRRDLGEDPLPRRPRRRRRSGASIRTIPTCSSPPSGTSTARPGACRAAARAAASSNPPTAATTGPKSRAIPACPRASSARSASPSPAPIPTASTPSSRTKTAALCLRRRRRHLEAGQRRSQPPPARLLLHPHLCRPQSQGHRLRAQHRLLQIHRRRQDLPHDSPAARRQSRSVDRPRQSAAHDRKQRRRRQRLRQRRPDLDRPGVSPPRSSITSPSPRTSRTTSAARSRTAPPSAFPARAGGGRGGGAAARRNTYGVGGGESGYIAPDPRNPNIFYAGSQGALLTRFDRRTNYSKDVQVYPLFFSGENAGSLPERWQWTFPIVFSPVNPDILYTSSQHLWKTTDEGHSWTRSSRPDARRSQNARRFRRPHHPRSERPRNLRHHLHHRALAQRREHHLDRFRRRPGLHHARRRQDHGPRSRRPACPISAASA